MYTVEYDDLDNDKAVYKLNLFALYFIFRARFGHSFWTPVTLHTHLKTRDNSLKLYDGHNCVNFSFNVEFSLQMCVHYRKYSQNGETHTRYT